MTIASFLSRRRRVLAICAASTLLHYLAIGWVGARISADIDATTASEPPVISARLSAPVPPPPPLAQPAAAPPPARRAQRPGPPGPRPAAAPIRPPSLAELSTDEVLAESGDDTGSGGVGEGLSLASDAIPDAAVELPQMQAEAEPAPAGPRYQVSLPPSADLTLDVARTDASGTNWSGLMVMSWKRSGGAYTMTVEASISMLVARVTLATLTSEGAIGAGGIAPHSVTEKRRGKAQTATTFDAQQRRITFSASDRSYPLAPGAQDKATLPLQLSGIARADTGQLTAGIEIQVGEDKDATLFNFVVLGQEDIDTAMGRIATLRLSRPPRPGAYNSRLDIWLAPAHNWYPVQIRNTEANGAVTTQTIRKIVVTDVGN